MTRHRTTRKAEVYRKAYRTDGPETVSFEVTIADGPEAGRRVIVTAPNDRAEWLAQSILDSVNRNRNDIIRRHLAEI